MASKSTDSKDSVTKDGATPPKDTKVTVKIPRPLYNKIQLLIEDSGFNSPTDFIVYVIRDLVGEQEPGSRDREFTPEELRSIKRKLRNLGYLD